MTELAKALARGLMLLLDQLEPDDAREILRDLATQIPQRMADQDLRLRRAEKREDEAARQAAERDG